jgi:hypothetical protein
MRHRYQPRRTKNTGELRDRSVSNGHCSQEDGTFMINGDLAHCAMAGTPQRQRRPDRRHGQSAPQQCRATRIARYRCPKQQDSDGKGRGKGAPAPATF